MPTLLQNESITQERGGRTPLCQLKHTGDRCKQMRAIRSETIQSGELFCSVLSVLQCVAVYCIVFSGLQCVAVCCSVLQGAAAWNLTYGQGRMSVVSHRYVTQRNVPCVAVCCSMLQYAAFASAGYCNI